MASPTVNVVRWTALVTGVIYGVTHQGTLQKSYDTSKAKHAEERREHLIQEAREAYKSKLLADKHGAANALITDIEDPKFDLEKLIAAYTKESS